MVATKYPTPIIDPRPRYRYTCRLVLFIMSMRVFDINVLFSNLFNVKQINLNKSEWFWFKITTLCFSQRLH